MGSITRSQLIGKDVYNPDGSYIGSILDVGFTIGSGQMTLVIKISKTETIELEWEKVSAAQDITILKENLDLNTVKKTIIQPAQPELVQQQNPQQKGGFLSRRGSPKEPEHTGPVTCPTCGNPATWVPQYNRYYCYTCQKYL